MSKRTVAPTLRSEVERLAALSAAVERIRDRATRLRPSYSNCSVCGHYASHATRYPREVQHTDDCPLAEALAILAAADRGQGDDP